VVRWQLEAPEAVSAKAMLPQSVNALKDDGNCGLLHYPRVCFQHVCHAR